MHRFEPLAPRYANEEDEFVPAGFNRWVKTWMADYASVEEIYWPVPGDAVDAAKLPARAFDSETQREQTAELVEEYNQVLHVTPELDARFAALAEQRIRHAPLRYYLWLPLLRVADMWLRPRTETLPSDTRWWEFNDDPKWSALAVALGIIGLVYIGMAIGGLAVYRCRTIALFGAAAYICDVAIHLSRDAGKSRAPVHAGVLSSRDHPRSRLCCPSLITTRLTRSHTYSV